MKMVKKIKTHLAVEEAFSEQFSKAPFLKRKPCRNRNKDIA
jgi:hypothetical protein